MDTIYKKLAEHLNALPVPFPATDTGVELKILERWFSEQEARSALNMKGYPEPVSKIAKRLDIPQMAFGALSEGNFTYFEPQYISRKSCEELIHQTRLQ